MNTHKHLFLFFISALLLFACSDSHEKFHKSKLIDTDFTIQKVDSFTVHNGPDTDYTIGKLRFNFASNNDNTLHAFYDAAKHRFVITGTDGTIKNVISKKGRGPGEITKALGFNFNDDNNLMVYDNPQKMLKIFGLNGEVVHHSKVQQSIYPITSRQIITHNNKLYAPTIKTTALSDFSKLNEKLTHSKLFGIYNYQGSLIDTLGQFDPSVEQTNGYDLSALIDINFKNKQVVSTHKYNYRVQIHDLRSGKRTAWFGKKTAHFHESEEYISPNLPRQKQNRMARGISSPVKIFQINNKIFLYFETLTESFFKTEDFNDKKPFLAIYNSKTHNSYGDVKLPYILGEVAGGKLYLIENSNPDHFTVGIYEVNQDK